MSKLKVTTISDPTNDNTAITIDTSGNVSFSGTVTGAMPDAIDVNASATADSLNIDSSGRVTIPYQPSFLAVKSNGNQGSISAVLFNTVAHNIGSHYSTSTGRFTAPVDGYYFLSFSGHAENSQPVRANMQKNGTTMTGGTRYSTGASHQAITISNIQYLSANDYVTVNINAGTFWGSDAESGLQFSGRLVG